MRSSLKKREQIDQLFRKENVDYPLKVDALHYLPALAEIVDDDFMHLLATLKSVLQHVN